MAEEVASSAGGGCFRFVMDKLIIPATLAILGTAGGLLQWSIEQVNIQESRVRESNVYDDGIVSSYVSDMSGLITSEGNTVELIPCVPYTDELLDEDEEIEPNSMAQLMRGRTLLALSQVGAGVSRGEILRFVSEVGIASVLDRRDLQHWFLNDADLQGTCLIDFDLSNATLNNAWMILSDLDGIILTNATVINANLDQAGLSNAVLFDADFTDSVMTSVNMAGADISGTIFDGVDLTDSYMGDALIDDLTSFDENTILPDGSLWTASTDIERFTDLDHSDFWDACEEREYIIWYCR